MTLTLDLPPQLEYRLSQEAERRGITVGQFTLQLLDKHLPAKDDPPQIVSLLQSWIDEGDTAEQKETGDYLIRTLDEDRLSDRKLFPPELQGVAW